MGDKRIGGVAAAAGEARGFPRLLVDGGMGHQLAHLPPTPATRTGPRTSSETYTYTHSDTTSELRAPDNLILGLRALAGIGIPEVDIPQPVPLVTVRPTPFQDLLLRAHNCPWGMLQLLEPTYASARSQNAVSVRPHRLRLGPADGEIGHNFALHAYPQPVCASSPLGEWAGVGLVSLRDVWDDICGSIEGCVKGLDEGSYCHAEPQISKNRASWLHKCYAYVQCK